MVLALALPWEAWGEPVGRLTRVEGRVELMKGDKPAVTLKVGDEVEPGDAIRTKSLSAARVLFLDDSILDIAPESRVAIEEYLYDASQGKRRAVLRIFRGLIKASVNRILKAADPDFLMKTHTAVLGVRGTKTYVNPGPTFTDAYNEEGKVSARNAHSEISGEVTLKAMEFSRIGFDLPPTLPMPLAKEDLQLLGRQFDIRARQRNGGAAGGDPSASSPSGPGAAALPAQPAVINIPGSDQFMTSRVTDLGGGMYVPPPAAPMNSGTFSFSQTLAGNYLLTSPSPQSVGTFAGSGSGVRIGVYSGSYNATFTFIATSSPYTFSPLNTGTINLTSQGSVQGIMGRVLTGTMTMTGSTSGGTSFSLRGPVTLQAGGNLTFSPTGSFSLGGRTGAVTGNLAQAAR